MSHSHSGAQIIPKDGAVEATLEDIVTPDQHIRLVRTVNDADLDITRGLIDGKISIHKFGTNPAVPNGVTADIWHYGPTQGLYDWPTTSEGFRIRAGGDVNDTAAGTGAQEVIIQFLDATGLPVTETLATAGAAASASTSVTGRRVNRAFIGNVGTYHGSNTGVIIIENDVTNQVVATIPAGVGQTQQTMYTVPLGWTGFVEVIDINVAVGTNKDANIILWQSLGAYDTTTPFGGKRLVRQWSQIQGTLPPAEFQNRPRFPALTDLWFTGIGNGAATGVDIDYDIVIIED